MSVCDRHKNDKSFYCGKNILGPMVRIGTLPMRLLSLRHGADLVFSEEIIDFKLISSKRIVNSTLNTIDFIDNTGMVIFRTCQEEKQKVILQIGTSNAQRALAAAKRVIDDVAGIDINMGCPKSFSLKGGMGAALLSKPELIRDILTTLRKEIDKPVSCKIRVLPSLDETLELARLIESTGVDAIIVHGRTKEERPRDPNRTEFIASIASSVSVPVVLNGESCQIDDYSDLDRIRKQAKACSIMVSRAAMKNFTIFNRSKAKPAEMDSILDEYIRLSIQVDNSAINSKYCIMQMLGSWQESAEGKQFQACYDQQSLCAVVGLSDYYHSVLSERESVQAQARVDCTTPSSHDHETMGAVENDPDRDGVIEMPVHYVSHVFSMNNQPKVVLNQWVTREKLEPPVFKTYPVDKHFYSVAHFLGKSYASSFVQLSKRYSEHAAAMVILLSHGRYPDMDVARKVVLKNIEKTRTMHVVFNGRRLQIKIK